ncbi:uncharacterized protein LOC122515586 [Polistes fuscatus]|uniref:uncharacterized protein LOC122515586 n=1 Tax=Polistes fuscatus TaxID=30207 RepID=UPI001CA8E50E|nr:uncharacterized protein LOC122515586 [Polistes fuscatus]
MNFDLQVTSAATTTTPSTNTVSPSVNDMDWFAGVTEEELLYYSGVGNDVDSLWAVIGSFVPPPPRPPYLPEEGIATDGLTTCDLCSWAWRNDRHPFSLDGTLEASGEIGWVLTLVIVSLVSAGIGAVVMVTLLHCRRMKNANGRASCCGVGVEDPNTQEAGSNGGGGGNGGGVAVIPDRAPLELDKLPPYHDVAPSPGHNVWSWLGSRRGGGTTGVVTTPLSLPQHRRAMNLPVENHYTHMQTDEALYAELDSQAASYASDFQLQMRGSSAYGTTSAGQDDEYHELDAARLHRHYGTSNGDESLQRETLRTRHSKRLQELDYEMYENEPPTPNQLQHHHHHHHHHNNHHHHHQDLRVANRNGERPSYQNTAYTGSDAEPDGPTLSSAPSSAYYSDLSSNSANQQMPSNVSSTAPTTQTNLHLNPQNLETPQYRLAAINESTVPSDYI